MEDAQLPIAGRRPARDLDMESLKALSHPLRVQMLDALSVYGPATASGLAERLAESSGATSYHLRQLEKHGFVREVDDRGTGRERWWERNPEPINIGSPDAEASPGARAASQLIYRELRISQERLLDDFVNRGASELDPDWQDAGELTTTNTRLTLTQMHDFVGAVNDAIEKYVIPFRRQQVPGARTVHVEFNAFPVVDATPTTSGDAS